MESFTIPKVSLLLVDDNEINLNVAVAMLEPFEAHIDIAENGKEALDKIRNNHYDFILMDHLMPVMDGIEAVTHIREEGYETPVFVLTANVPEDDGKMYYKAGFDGMLSKPINPNEVGDLLLKYLPADMIVKADDASDENTANECAGDIPDIEGVDREYGLEHTGSPEMYLRSLGDFYKQISRKTTKIRKCLDDGLIEDLTVEVHGLKSVARLLGMLDLSKRFEECEELGKKEDTEGLMKAVPETLKMYNAFYDRLKGFGMQNDENKVETPVSEIVMRLKEIRDGMEDFNLDLSDRAMKELNTYKVPENIRDDIEELDALVADVAMEDVIDLTRKLIAELGDTE